MQWFWDKYLSGVSVEDAAARGAFPIRAANLADLPPTLLCTAGRDPLRDEGIAMVAELQTAGVAVDYEHFPHSEHGFACSLGPSDDFHAWLKRCADWIEALHKSED
jgi:acetyl esterase